jgi:uncharacterized protein YhhL (DUF1145 family)
MLNMVIGVTKIALLMFWLACILSLVSVIPEPYGRTILWIGGVLLLVHLVEYLFDKSRVAERSGGDTGFIQTMTFGFAHWLPVLKRPD